MQRLTQKGEARRLLGAGGRVLRPLGPHSRALLVIAPLVKAVLVIAPLVMAVLVMAVQAGCSPVAPSAPSSEQARVQVPPGAQEEATHQSFQTLLEQARSADQARRGGEALRLYRAALAAAPAELASADRAALSERIQSLAFTLGVELEEARPGAASASAPSGSDPAKTSTGSTGAAASSTALEQARSRFADAMARERSGKSTEALELYRGLKTPELLALDATLYWQVFQKVEDLAPKDEKPVPAAGRPGLVVRYHDPTTPTSSPGEEADLPGEVPIRSVQETRAKDPEAQARLARARELYLTGMSAARTGSPEQARESFQQVLSLIEERQDPELVRATRQNLRDLPPAEK